MAIAADLLGMDPQALRRLSDTLAHRGHRPSGNQRRFSRADLELFDQAAALSEEGHNALAIRRIIDLEQQVADLSGAKDPA